REYEGTQSTLLTHAPFRCETRNRDSQLCPCGSSQGIRGMKRIHRTPSQGKDSSSAKTSRFVNDGCILGSHGFGCATRGREAQNKASQGCDELKAQVRMLLRRVSALRESS
ncbi:hypothetical protein HID58_091854, partial [Brassica napus]